jgi:hypothetical protein
MVSTTFESWRAAPVNSRIIPPSQTRTLLVVLNVDDGRLELPGCHLAVEQDIDFAVGTVLEFRKAKVRRHEADTCSGSPDVSTLSSHIPSSRVEHLRGEVDHRNLSNVVSGSTNTGAECTKTDRRCLGNDGVRDGTHGTCEDEGDDDTETGLGIVGGDALWDGCTDTEDEEQGDVGGSTPEVDSATAEPAAEGPCEDVGNQLET